MAETEELRTARMGLASEFGIFEPDSLLFDVMALVVANLQIREGFALFLADADN